MSEANKAVFLSYASQDAEAAKKICDALRASGVEVWFDQNELVGGDAWDAKIRKQIADCALFVPLISAATQARTEGYFRLEWKLAAQRTHMIADDAAFLLPVVIDETRDAEARVPAEFKAVQWTRLPGGEAAEKFCARVRALLGGEGAVAGSDVGARLVRAQEGGRGRATPLQKSSRPWLVPIIVGAVALAALAIWAPWKKNPPASTTTAPVSEARQRLARARDLFGNPNYTRDDLSLAEDLCKQAIALDPNDAEAWAIYAELSSEFIGGGSDVSAERYELARTQAERAVKLAPNSTEARFAKASYLRRVGGVSRVEAEKILRELAVETPRDPRVLISLGKVIWGNIGAVRNLERANEALGFFAQAAALPAGRAEALGESGWLLYNLGRYAEAEPAIDESLRLRPSKSATQSKVILALARGDLAVARTALTKLHPDLMRSDLGASIAARVWLWSREPDKCLEALSSISRDYLASTFFRGPTDFLRGYAYHLAGKQQAAGSAWRAALQVVDKRLVEQPRDDELLMMRAYLLALLGQREAAVTALRLYEELYPPTGDRNTGELWIIGVHALLEPPERAIGLLEVLFKDKTSALLKDDPRFDVLRGHPRFEALRARMEAATSATAVEKIPVEKSVAVLAFKNLSGDPAREFFSDGLSEAVADVLGRVPGLKVAGSTSAFSFKGRAVPIPEIARQLAVSHIVEGTVLQEGSTVRITAKLLNADGFQVWVSDKLDREVKNILALHDEVAALIAKQLSLKLGVAPADGRRAVNPDAYQLYLQGRNAWNARSEAGYLKAEDLFSRAIDLDPLFARAYVGRADARMFLATQRGLAGRSSQRDSPALLPVEADVRRALELEPGLADGHASLANLHLHRGDPESAQRELQRAVELNPNYATAHQWLGIHYWRRGMLPEARASVLRAVETDPLSSVIAAACSVVLQDFGESAAALAQAERAVELQPGSARAQSAKAAALLRSGRREAAVAVARTITEPSSQGLGRAMFVLGRAGELEEVERKRHASGPHADLLRLQGAAVLGKWDEFFTAWGPQMVTLDDPWFLYMPALDPVREDPRFLAVLNDAGLREAHARAQAWRAAHPPENVAK